MGPAAEVASRDLRERGEYFLQAKKPDAKQFHTNIFIASAHKNILVDPEDVSSGEAICPSSAS